MKHLIVSCIAIIIGLNITALAQMTDDKSEVYIEQVMYHEDSEVIELNVSNTPFAWPDHILVENFLYLNMMLQDLASGVRNVAYGLQDGDRNTMEIKQTGSGHTALSMQYGSGNTHDITQNASNTAAAGLQVGDNNTISQLLDGYDINAIAIQIGNGNSIISELSGLFGGGAFGIQQEGKFNMLHQYEYGKSVPYRVRQSGNGMELMIIEGQVVR